MIVISPEQMAAVYALVIALKLEHSCGFDEFKNETWLVVDNGDSHLGMVADGRVPLPRVEKIDDDRR